MPLRRLRGRAPRAGRAAPPESYGRDLPGRRSKVPAAHRSPTNQPAKKNSRSSPPARSGSSPNGAKGAPRGGPGCSIVASATQPCKGAACCAGSAADSNCATLELEARSRACGRSASAGHGGPGAGAEVGAPPSVGAAATGGPCAARKSLFGSLGCCASDCRGRAFGVGVPPVRPRGGPPPSVVAGTGPAQLAGSGYASGPTARCSTPAVSQRSGVGGKARAKKVLQPQPPRQPAAARMQGSPPWSAVLQLVQQTLGPCRTPAGSQCSGAGGKASAKQFLQPQLPRQWAAARPQESPPWSALLQLAQQSPGRCATPAASRRSRAGGSARARKFLQRQPPRQQATSRQQRSPPWSAVLQRAQLSPCGLPRASREAVAAFARPSCDLVARRRRTAEVRASGGCRLRSSPASGGLWSSSKRAWGRPYWRGLRGVHAGTDSAAIFGSILNFPARPFLNTVLTCARWCLRQSLQQEHKTLALEAWWLGCPKAIHGHEHANGERAVSSASRWLQPQGSGDLPMAWPRHMIDSSGQ